MSNTDAKKTKMMVVPVDVCIRRFYRVYVHVPENASVDDIYEQLGEDILENQDKALTPDPDMEIEDHDIQWCRIDREGAWPESESQEISEILKKK